MHKESYDMEYFIDGVIMYDALGGGGIFSILTKCKLTMLPSSPVNSCIVLHWRHVFSRVFMYFTKHFYNYKDFKIVHLGGSTITKIFFCRAVDMYLNRWVWKKIVWRFVDWFLFIDLQQQWIRIRRLRGWVSGWGTPMTRTSIIMFLQLS